MHVTLKNMPRLKLSDLLKRRKMTLLQFINESSVQTYEALVIRCDRIGVQPPTRDEYVSVKPEIVSSPQDGVIVLEAPPVISEITGYKLEDSNTPENDRVDDPFSIEYGIEDSQKKRRKKKENPSE